jgi:hypothetical protein
MQQELSVTPGPNASIVLNCTYVIENSENVFFVQWRKKNGSDYYSVLAEFDSNSANFVGNEDGLKNRSDLFNYGNGSTITKILKINDVRCEDEGRYQCFISYKPQNSVSSTIYSQNTDVFLQGK